MTHDHIDKFSGVRVIVLGATGFIGRWVARGLCEAGAEVFATVRNPSAAADIFALFGIDAEMCEMDLRDENSVRSVYQEVRPSVTFNLAAYGVDPEEQDEELAGQTNVLAIGSICSAVSAVRDSTWPGLDIVNVGTAMEYGLTGGDLVESARAKPTTLYGRSKLAGTRALADACRSLGLKGTTARLFSVYGPGESSRRLLPSLIEAAAEKDPIPLTAGTHKRDFVYVEDAAEGLLRLAVAPRPAGEAVNVATGTLSSVRKYVETAGLILGIDRDRLRFGALPTRSEEMSHEPVNVELLRALTGWVPDTTIASGVRKSVQFQMDPSAIEHSPFRPLREEASASFMK